MKKRNKFFSDELKLKVATEYINSDITREELMSKYGFTGGGNIDRWIRQFGLKKPSDEEAIQLYEMSKFREKPKSEQELEKRIKELEKQLEYANLKAKALDTMIDIAAKELDIQIRKKSGPKQ